METEIMYKIVEILKANCCGIDDILKSEQFTCYTIQKGKHHEAVMAEFGKLGYKPETVSEDEHFITFKIPFLK